MSCVTVPVLGLTVTFPSQLNIFDYMGLSKANLGFGIYCASLFDAIALVKQSMLHQSHVFFAPCRLPPTLAAIITFSRSYEDIVASPALANCSSQSLLVGPQPPSSRSA